MDIPKTKCLIWHQIGKEGSTMEMKEQVTRILEKLTDEQVRKNGAILRRVYFLLCIIYRQA